MYRNLRGDFGQFNRPTESAIRDAVKHFEENRGIADNIRPVHYRGVRSAENIDTGSESVAKEPSLSFRQRSQFFLACLMAPFSAF